VSAGLAKAAQAAALEKQKAVAFRMKSNRSD
jgi:hypothetical protein